MKKNSLLFLCLLLTIIASSQDDQLIPVKKLKKDFEVMTELIEAHPAPYRHISKEQLDHLIDSTAQLITEPMDNIRLVLL